MLLRLAPPERIGEMFGLYGLVGKFSAVIGPILYGAIVASLLDTLDRGAYQIAIASLFGLLIVGLVILRGVPEGDAGQRGRRRRGPRGGHGRVTLIVAHRGASGMAPENTMEAFKLGVEAGADAIELDVHLTADGQLAVIHDETLDRTTDRTGARREPHDGRDPRGRCGRDVHRPGRRGPSVRGARASTVPTLPEVLEWLPDSTGLVIEIKARAAADAVVQAIEGHPARADGRISVISFDEATIDRVRELDPGIRTGYLVAPGQRRGASRPNAGSSCGRGAPPASRSGRAGTGRGPARRRR